MAAVYLMVVTNSEVPSDAAVLDVYSNFMSNVFVSTENLDFSV